MNRALKATHVMVSIILLLTLTTCDKKTQKTIQYRQYYAQGQHLYIVHCGRCHQPDGMGLANLYPPVRQSDFMEEHLDKTLCLIRYGISGEIRVNGIHYNRPMPGILQLAPLEIAEIATYIYNLGDDEKGLIETSCVEKALRKCER